MRKLGLLLACTCLSVAGCGGGGMSEAQMRARSRARSPDELESALASTAAPAAAAAPAAVVAAANSTAGVPKAAAPVKSAEIPVPPDPPTEAGAVVVVVQNEPPSEPLTTLEKEFRSIENLRRIGQALNAYVIEHHVLPAQALRNEKGKPTLSWRVAILPQLGYESLYMQFRLHEPWDSPHNRQLIAQIPPELQSPHRFDSSTTYLATIAPGSVFGQARGLAPQSFDDGPENTVLLVEVLDELAIAWTQPADLNIGTGSIPAGSVRQHPEGTLLLLADGSVKVAPGDTPATVLRGLVTPSGDERILAAYVLKDPPRPPRPRILPVLTAASGTLGSVLPTPPPEEPAEAAVPTIDLTKLPVPDEESLAHARSVLKELYGQEVEAARKPEERAALVPMLLLEAAQVQTDPAEYFEILRIIRDLAASLGDADHAWQAIDLLADRFQVDAPAMRLQTLDELTKWTRTPTAATALSPKARDLVNAALDRDDFDSAVQAQERLLALSRIAGERKEIQDATQLQTTIAAARRAYIPVPAMRTRIAADPNDGEANSTVGRYLCLTKGHWSDGLPLMIRGDDVKLRVMASIELELSRAPKQTLSLAEQYWELAAKVKPPESRHLHLRAAYCYELAANQLPGSLDKVKATKRIEEVNLKYGAEGVKQAILRMKIAAGTAQPAVTQTSEE